MKTLFTCIAIVSLMIFSGSANSQTWEQSTDLDEDFRRHHPVTFTLNGNGYSLTGSEPFGSATTEMNRFDPVTETWEELDDFPGLPRSFSYGAENGDEAFMGFGYIPQTGEWLNDLWKYNPDSENWTQLTSCPCVGRSHPAFILVEDKIFMGLGSSTQNFQDWWEYDIPSDSWTQLPNFPGVPRHHPFYFDLNGYAYVGFGHGAGIYSDFYRWNLETEAWEQLDDFPGESRVAGTQFSHEGFGYVLSGDGDDHDFMNEGEFWQYEPEEDSWNQLPSHPGLSRWAPGSFIIDGVVYFLQGQERFIGFPGSEISNSMLKFDLDLYNSPFSVNDLKSENKVQIYPNPATETLYLDVKEVSTYDITVLDALGKIILKSSDVSEISVSDFKTGIYTIQIISDKGSVTKEFMKQ